MKLEKNHYAPLLFGVILILAGLSDTIFSLIGVLSRTSFLAGTIVQLLVYLLPLAFYCQVRSINLVSQVKVRYVAPKKIPFLVVMTLIFLVGATLLRYFGLFYFSEAFVDTPSAIFIPDSGENAFLVTLCSVILPAILEEVVFRGILLEEYRSYGVIWAVGISALMFSMVHISLENFVYYLFMGIVFGIITVASDSIVPTVLLHVAMNFSYFHFRPTLVEYLRQAGKSPLLPYLLIALFILLFVFMFSRLENIYQDMAYEELLQTRKEMLRREIELARGATDEEEKKEEHPHLTVLKEICLSIPFIATVVIFILLVSGIFS